MPKRQYVFGGQEESPAQVEDFLKEYEALCRKHNVCMDTHEQGSHAYVRPLDEERIQWALKADLLYFDNDPFVPPGAPVASSQYTWKRQSNPLAGHFESDHYFDILDPEGKSIAMIDTAETAEVLIRHLNERPSPPPAESVVKIQNFDVLTVQALKGLIKDWPDLDRDGELAEVWIQTGCGLSSPVSSIWPLNMGTDEDGKPVADIELMSKAFDPK